MDNGAGPQGPGSIGATWELGYSAWPPKRGAGHAPTSSAPAGRSAPKPVQRGGAVSYTADPDARPAQTLPGDGAEDAWKAQPPYDWAPIAAGKGLGFVTAALAKDVVIAGPSSLDLYLSPRAKDTDLQVTLSEVRPDGNETYVQNGWLRASHRKLDARALDRARPRSRRTSKRTPRRCPRARYSLVRVPIFPVAHAFRAGSRIRVTVEAVGGDRPRWDFATVDKGNARNTIALGGRLRLEPRAAGRRRRDRQGHAAAGRHRAARRAQPPYPPPPTAAERRARARASGMMPR